MLNRLLILQLLFLTLLSLAVSKAADFHDYVPLSAAKRANIVSSGSRTVLDLTGEWKRSVDGATPVTVQLPTSAPDNSRAVYSREFRIEAADIAKRSWHFVFFGVADEIEIRINGKSVQKYPGGTAPFIVRIPDRSLIAGTNSIELTVGPTGDRTSVVLRNARYGQRQHLGVIREVMLVGTAHVWTSSVRTQQTFSQQGATLAVEATITTGPVERLVSTVATEDAPGATRGSVTAEAVLVGPSGVVVARGTSTLVAVESSRNINVQFLLATPNVMLWSPINPALYQLEIRIVYQGAQIDDMRTDIGFRSVRVAAGQQGRQIVVNDTVMPMFAVDYMEEYPKVGPSMSARQFEQDVKLLKTLGVNTVRVRHVAPHPYFVYLCDRYGLFLIVDLPATDIPERLLNIEETTARLRNAADRVVTAYDTHASILAYNVSDGLDEKSPSTRSTHEVLVSDLRRRGTKLVSKCIPAGLAEDVSEGGFDLIILRFLTPSDRNRIGVLAAAAQNIVTRAALITTFGTAVSPENSQGFSNPLSTQAQALVIRDMAKATAAAGLAGYCVHAFNDYTLSRPTMNVEADEADLATFGLVDQWRQRRVSFDMLVSIINDEKEPLLQARDFSDDTPLVFISTGIILALILVFLVNRSRRFREYVLRSVLRPYNFYADIRDQRILSTVQTAILGVVIAACVGLIVASLLYYLRTSQNVEYALLLLLPNDSLFEILRFVAWRPALSVVTLTLVSYGALIIVSSLLRLSAVFVKGRILFRDTLTISVWSALPMIVLLPVGIAFYQALSAEAMSVWVPIVIIAVVVWVFMRTLKATSVVFDVPPLFVYGIGIGFTVVVLALTLWVYDSTSEFLAYLSHYVGVVIV